METYFIVRCKEAGVFFANIASRNGEEATLENAVRIFYWEGAASLSQLAMEGVKFPEKCKFSMSVPEIIVIGVIEIIPCTDVAVKNILSVPTWKI